MLYFIQYSVLQIGADETVLMKQKFWIHVLVIQKLSINLLFYSPIFSQGKKKDHKIETLKFKNH